MGLWGLRFWAEDEGLSMRAVRAYGVRESGLVIFPLR